MGFLPARMTRLLVGGHKSHLEATIETLHAEGAIHLEDYQDPTGTTRIGTPLPAGESVSDLLVRVRGLQKALGAEGVKAAKSTEDAASAVPAIEAQAQPALDQVLQLRATLVQADAEQAALAPFGDLDLDLGGLTGLTSVKVYVGTVRSDPRPALQRAGVDAEVQLTSTNAVAVIVAARNAQAADKALAESGYSAAQLPQGRSGTPANRLSQLAAERASTAAQLAQAEGHVASLRASLGARLAGLERKLAAASEKTQAPLRFAVTESTFHAEGWVPRSAAGRVTKALHARFGDKVYVADLGDGAAPAHGHSLAADTHAHAGPGEGPGSPSHGHDHAHGEGTHGEAHEDDGHHGHDAKDEPPIHLENPKVARPYQFLLGLLGKPRYGEVDPTKLMLVFFPLFFGLMVGDLAVGLIIMGVGFFLKTNRVFGIGGPAVGKTLIAGGLMAALVGGFVFGEALGIHFVTPEPHEEGEEKELSWEEIGGWHLGSTGLIHKSGGAHGGDAHSGDAGADEHDATGDDLVEGEPGIAPTSEITTHATEAEESKGIFTPHTDEHLVVGGITMGWYSKTHDTLALLVWAMVIGFVHIVLGLLIGVRNVYKAHGVTLAIQEKVAWLTLIAGGILAILMWGELGGYVGLGVAVASVVLLYMGAQHVLGVGFIALLEIPGLAGNILSYTRLAAIGASKAGMAIAFADIGFNVIAGGNVHSPVGWLVYLAAFMLIVVLSIIAGSLQSLRLQFVEFFGKFYTGGGRPYVPFGRRAP